MSNLLATLGQQYEIIAGTGIAENKVVTFDGSNDGNVGALRLFHVTGVVAVKIYPQCLTSLVSASGTLALGTATNTTGFITTTTATNILTHKTWIGTPAALATDVVANFPVVITDEDIVLTVATALITQGVISFTAIWRPLSPGANLTAFVRGSSVSASASPSASISASASRSLSPSSSASASLSTSPSSSVSPSSSSSSSASLSLSPSSSVSPSSSASASLSRSPSASVSASLSPSSSVSPSSSASRSLSPSSSASSSSSPSASKSASLSPSSSVSPSASTSPGTGL